MDFLLEKLWLFVDGAGAGSWNMSLDEALLRDCAVSVLRIYGWSRREISFGCLMPFEEVHRTFGGRDPLVRRWTGGGIVEHGSDWTYSLMVPSSLPESRWSPAESYLRIHDVLVRTLRCCGVEAELREHGRVAAGGHCFEKPVAYDVMSGPGKIAGAAQRRCRHGLLHQGSVQSRSLPSDFGARLAAALSPGVHVMPSPPDAVLVRAAALCGEKYGTEAWLRRR
jgi:lipoate-protein ligase A